MKLPTISLSTWAPLLCIVLGGTSSNVARAQCALDKVIASDGLPGDALGVSVAVDGDLAVIGAFRDDEMGTDAGAAYVFRFDGTSWVEEAKLLADDGAAGDRFGRRVAVSGDTVLIGAWADDDLGVDSGSAYVFYFNGSGWTQQAKLLPDDGAPADQFGRSVAIFGDTAVIGSLNDGNSGPGQEDGHGSAYVFVRDLTIAWTQQAKLLAADAAPGDKFGISAALEGDTAIIGASNDGNSNPVVADGHGSAYIFARDPSGAWGQDAKLLASDAAAGDRFGISVSVSGAAVVIGASGDDDSGETSGSAYVFRFNAGSWSQEAKLTAPNGAAWDYFGERSAISGDTIVIGANGDDDNGPGAGAAYVFRRSTGAWNQVAKLTASDGATWDAFGSFVDLSGDDAVIGAVNDNDNGDNSGSVYFFDLAGADCNHNGICDRRDIFEGTSLDVNDDSIPDECEVHIPAPVPRRPVQPVAGKDAVKLP